MSVQFSTYNNIIRGEGYVIVEYNRVNLGPKTHLSPNAEKFHVFRDWIILNSISKNPYIP